MANEMKLYAVRIEVQVVVLAESEDAAEHLAQDSAEISYEAWGNAEFSAYPILQRRDLPDQNWLTEYPYGFEGPMSAEQTCGELLGISSDDEEEA